MFLLKDPITAWSSFSLFFYSMTTKEFILPHSKGYRICMPVFLLPRIRSLRACLPEKGKRKKKESTYEESEENIFTSSQWGRSFIIFSFHACSCVWCCGARCSQPHRRISRLKISSFIDGFVLRERLNKRTIILAIKPQIHFKYAVQFLLVA